MIKQQILSVTMAILITVSTFSSVWADPGGGGGGLGGGGASGPEPSQWYFMIIVAIVLGSLGIYRLRAQKKSDG